MQTPSAFFRRDDGELFPLLLSAAGVQGCRSETSSGPSHHFFFRARPRLWSSNRTSRAAARSASAVVCLCPRSTTHKAREEAEGPAERSGWRLSGTRAPAIGFQDRITPSSGFPAFSRRGGSTAPFGISTQRCRGQITDCCARARGPEPETKCHTHRVLSTRHTWMTDPEHTSSLLFEPQPLGRQDSDGIAPLQIRSRAVARSATGTDSSAKNRTRLSSRSDRSRRTAALRRARSRPTAA